jgi:hypothetical protein
MALIMATTQIFGNTYRGRATGTKLKELTDRANAVRDKIVQILKAYLQSSSIAQAYQQEIEKIINGWLRPLDTIESNDVWKLEEAGYYLEILTKKVRKYVRRLKENAENNTALVEELSRTLDDAISLHGRICDLIAILIIFPSRLKLVIGSATVAVLTGLILLYVPTNVLFFSPLGVPVAITYAVALVLTLVEALWVTLKAVDISAGSLRETAL